MTKIINTTPHSCRFQAADGFVYEVPPCGVLINARAVEEGAGIHPSGAELCRTKFVSDNTNESALQKLEREHPGPGFWTSTGPRLRAGATLGKTYAG